MTCTGRKSSSTQKEQYSTQAALIRQGLGSAAFCVSPQKSNDMQIPNVVILGNDEALVERALSELSRDGCRVSANVAASAEDVQLVVRDWRDGRCLDDPEVPVLTLDLAIITGQDLIDLVGRALGVPRRSSFTRFAVLFMIMHGRIPQA